MQESKNELFPVLEREIRERRILKKEIAGAMYMCPQLLTNRLNGKTEFTLAEALFIKEHFFPDMSVEELFRRGEKEND